MKQIERPTTALKKTILIADDDPDVVEALSARCRRMGLNVLTADDAFSALAKVKTEQPDVVCLDVSMPGGNGLSVGEMLSTDEECQSIPVMILTGHSDPETIRRCHNMIAYYIQKCPNVWSRVEPLLRELLEETGGAPRGDPAGRIPTPGNNE